MNRIRALILIAALLSGCATMTEEERKAFNFVGGIATLGLAGLSIFTLAR